VNVHADNDFAFRFACENGHLETARWVYTLGGVNVHACDDLAFRHACMCGHLETAKWLFLWAVWTYMPTMTSRFVTRVGAVIWRRQDGSCPWVE
jgi:hypothetical protein